MTNFKNYLDENNVFHHESMVYFSLCDEKKVLSLAELLRQTSDIAVEDYNEKNISREVLIENGFAILVSRCSFRIHKMPRENQRIVIKTQEEKNEPLQFVRSYEIESEVGEKLVSGLSTWLLVDLNARRILPIKKFTLRVPVTVEKEHDCLPCGKIVESENAQFIDERVIRFSDIDANGHTNNSRYAAFILDALPREYQTKDFSDFRINFSKEATLGEKLKIFADINDTERKIFVAGKTENGTSFDAELYWK